MIKQIDVIFFLIQCRHISPRIVNHMKITICCHPTENNQIQILKLFELFHIIIFTISTFPKHKYYIWYFDDEKTDFVLALFEQNYVTKFFKKQLDLTFQLNQIIISIKCVLFQFQFNFTNNGDVNHDYLSIHIVLTYDDWMKINPLRSTETKNKIKFKFILFPKFQILSFFDKC